MDLTILGSGASDARPERAPAGYVVRSGRTQIVLDVGSGTLGRLCAAGFRPSDTEAVLITHVHPDHISDLVPLLFDIKFTGGERERDLIVYGPPTFRRTFDGLMDLFGQWCVGETYDVVSREIERDRFEVGELRVTAHPVQHSIPAIGYRIEDPGGRILTVTGDTGPHAELVELARDAHVLVADSTLTGSAADSGHMSAIQAGALAAEARVDHLILTHLGREADRVDVVAEARTRFSGKVTKAVDLVSWNV